MLQLRAPAGRRTLARRRRRDQEKMAFALLLPAAVVVFGIIIYPVIRTLIISFFRVDSVLATSTPFVGLANYASVLTDGEFWATVGRTLYFTVVSTAAELILGMALALLLNAPLRGRWFFRAIVILPWALPTIVNGAMWRGIFNAQYGALNAALTQLHIIDHYHLWLGSPFLALNMVIVADVWKNTSLVAFFLLAGLQSVPTEIYESARVDGAGIWRRFTSLTLPLVIPSIAIVLVLRTVEAFKVFDIIYAMTRGGPANGTETVAFYAYLKAFSDQQFGLGSALAYLIVLAILLLTGVYLRLLHRSEMSLL